MLVLQPLALALLGLGHRAAAAHLAVGEVDHEVGVLLDGQVMVEGPVLGLLEGDEAVDDELVDRFGRLHELGVEEQAVAAEAAELAVDGRGGDVQIPGDLAVGHAAGGLGQQLREDVGSFEPVGGGEGLGAEGAAAVEAEKPLDTVGLSCLRK